MTPIIKRFVIKLLSKDQGSGITKLPGQMQAGFQESMVTEKLIRKGYDPRAIKSEEELKMILNRICLLYTSPSPRDRTRSRMPSSA